MKQLYFLSLSLFFLGCPDDDGVKPQINPLELTVEDTTCTEVFLKIHVGAEVVNRLVTLKRDTVILFSDFWLQTSDTLVIDEGLHPGRTYTYTATVSEKNTKKTLTVRTMDTTNHNFTFVIDTLGDGASSILYDVAIINDTLAYAVGEIYLKDSTGQIDPILYNMAKWNGQDWEITRLKINYKGNLITPSLNAIFAFSSTDIWLSAGVPIHGDGNAWTQYHLFDMRVLTQNDGSIVKMWGKNSQEMYFVGNKGTIVCYTGSSWQKVESGTSLPINDIWGSYNKQTGEYEVLCLASNIYNNQGKKVIRLTGNIGEPLPDETLPWSLSSIWFISNSRYYIAGDGMFEKKYIVTTSAPWKSLHQGITPYYTYRIRGENINHIVVAGAFGEVLTFNGVTWKSHRHQTQLQQGNYYSVAMRGKQIMSVGQIPGRAVIARGNRQ